MERKDVRKLRLGEILQENGILSQNQLETGLEAARKSGRKLGEVLISLGYLSESQLLEALSTQLGIPVVDLSSYPVDLEKVRIISEDWAKKFQVLVLGEKEGSLIMAMSNPLDYNTRDTIHMFTDLEIEVVIAGRADLEKAIQSAYREIHVETALGDMDGTPLPGEEPAPGEGEGDQGESGAPIITLLNNVLRKAVTSNASDVHFEPYDRNARIRMRIDGELREEFSLKLATYTNLVARIKVAANLNTVERRLPQDGRLHMVINQQDIDFRISVLPAYLGEKVVIRILNQSQALMPLEELGFTPEMHRQFQSLIRNPNGILLVTGPTGSGKTTTLYSALSEISDTTRNITTVENPVEYKLYGINQIQVNDSLGLGFNTILRTILRQDPDIIMVGEIRDEETASTAIRAANTGHLVLSTLHTNDSVATVARLMDIGIPTYLISDALRGVVSQRLVRRICADCREPYPAPEDEARTLGVDPGTTLYRGAGCAQCEKTGYRGRTAIYEILEITRPLRDAIEGGVSSHELYRIAGEQGYTSLEDACRDRVLEGTTTVREFGKIVHKSG